MINRVQTSSPAMQDHLSILRHELDFCSRLQPKTIADWERNGDLALTGNLHPQVIPLAVLQGKLLRGSAIRVAAKLRRGVKHARLAAYEQRFDAMFPDRRKDFDLSGSGSSEPPRDAILLRGSWTGPFPATA